VMGRARGGCVKKERKGEVWGGGRRKMPYLLRIMEANLAYSHAAVFLKVRPRGVDHGNIVALIAYKNGTVVSPIVWILLGLACPFKGIFFFASEVCQSGRGPNSFYPTFDRIRLRQLRAVLHQLFRDILPRLPRFKPEVGMCAGEVVGVELSGRDQLVSKSCRA